MIGRSGSAAVLALVLGAPQPLSAQAVGPPAPQPPSRERCQASSNPDEVVVCGRRGEDSPYRIPEPFRNQRSDDDAHASWDARWRDEQELARFSDQNVGPFGYLRRGREMYCGWLADRQIAQGRRPDCGRRPRPNDEADDWRRRTGE